MALLSKFEDRQAIILQDLAPTDSNAALKTKEVAATLRALRRPDLAESEAAGVEGENKTQALKRTLDRRSVLIGLPDHNPRVHRGVRNIEGVQVAPVAEFNTYDILKQRYLILTPEALAVLRERVKEKTTRRRAVSPAAPVAATEV